MKGMLGCIVALVLAVGCLYPAEAEAGFRGRSVSRTRTVQRSNVNRSFNRSFSRGNGHHRNSFNSFNRGFDCYGGGQEFFEERTVIRQSFR